MKNNFKGNNKADLLVTSPWGLGVLGLSNNHIIEYGISANGTRLGDWLLNTKDNNTELKADFDGNGKAELLMSSPWGIGILKLKNNQFDSMAMAKNGTRHGGWIIDTEKNQFLHAGDFDGDGKEEVLVTSPWGLGMLTYTNGKIDFLMLEPNGTRFGGWLLNTADNFFTLVGDFDGDGKTELLVTSPWGLGILKYNGTTLTSVVMVPNGTMLGEWELDTSKDRFEVVGDFDGDEKNEIVVSRVDKLGILKLENSHLSSLFVANNGTRLGNWLLESSHNQMHTVGDFDGDGKDEILFTSDWGLGVLKLGSNGLYSTVMAPNGTHFGNWLLNTRDNRLNYAADFDGDGKDEILITSPWGMGILEQSGNTFSTVTMSPNGTRFGGWLLNTVDNDLEAGLGQSYSVIIYHHQWQGAVNATKSYLNKRGYTLFVTPNGADGIAILKTLSHYLKSGDRLFVYLAGHGGSSRTVSDISQATSLTHILQFEDGAILGYDKFTPSFEIIGNKGVDLAVFDGSCDGGESVVAALGEHYLAMSTTAARAPGLTNTPNPSEIMKLFGKPSMFGLWWASQYTASLLTSKTPHRFYQKIYRNDNTEINRYSLFYRTAIHFYTTLSGGWYLKDKHCYLYQYIYPNEYTALSQAEKDNLTVDTDDYLNIKQADYDDFASVITHLKNILHDETLIDRGGETYVNAFPRAWQTIFGDMLWDVVSEPVKHSSMNNKLEPGTYIGKTGFSRMVNECLGIISCLDYCYKRSKTLLKEIDKEIKNKKLYTGTFKAQPRRMEKITDYLEYNEYEEKTTLRMQKIANQMHVDTTKLFKLLEKSTEGVSKEQGLKQLLDTEVNTVKVHMKDHILGRDTLDNLIASLNSIAVLETVYLDKLFYLLTIVEESISRVQMKHVAPGDMIKY